MKDMPICVAASMAELASAYPNAGAHTDAHAPGSSARRYYTASVKRWWYAGFGW